MKAFLDPNASISDPTDPASDSSAGSPVNGYWVKDLEAASYTTHTEFLVAETADALQILFKHANQQDAHDFAMLGNVMLPVFANDPTHDLDGLAVHGRTEDFVQNSGNGAYRVGTSDWVNGREDQQTYMDGPLQNGRHRPRREDVRDTSSEQILGHYKYYFHWLNGNFLPLERADDGSNDGYLVFTNGFNNGYAMRWDTSQPPTT